MFLYRHLLDQALNGSIDAVRAKQKDRLPTVMDKTEVSRVIANLSPHYQLVAQVLYGSGLRVMEAIKKTSLPVTAQSISPTPWQGNTPTPI